MKPNTYVACGACGHRRGVAAAECPRYNCPWLQNHKYREHVARKLGHLADRLFATYIEVPMDLDPGPETKLRRHMIVEGQHAA